MKLAHDLIFVLVLLALSIIALFFAISDYYFQQAKQQYSLDQQQQSLPAYQPTLSLLNKSLFFRKGNAAALDFKGDVLYRRWWQSPDGDTLEVSDLLKQAKKHHLEAAKIRRHWAFNQSQLARIQSHSLNLNDEFFTYFNRAYALGLFETTTALELLKLGLWRWDELDQTSRQKVLNLADASIAQKRNSLKTLAKLLHQYRLFELICDNTIRSKRQIHMCQAYPKS